MHIWRVRRTFEVVRTGRRDYKDLQCFRRRSSLSGPTSEKSPSAIKLWGPTSRQKSEVNEADIRLTSVFFIELSALPLPPPVYSFGSHATLC